MKRILCIVMFNTFSRISFPPFIDYIKESPPLFCDRLSFVVKMTYGLIVLQPILGQFGGQQVLLQALTSFLVSCLAVLSLLPFANANADKKQIADTPIISFFIVFYLVLIYFFMLKS